jgi:HlyD family secretion protein
MAQLSANYRAQLRTEGIEADRERSRLAQEIEKITHRQSLAELRAPANGIVKDLATHTAGSVLASGAVLMTLVPEGEALVAEVWLQNQDAGFVRAGQTVKLKLASFPFQRYGMLDGRVLRVSADASERNVVEAGRPAASHAYRALVELPVQDFRIGDATHALLPGMQLTAEIRLADRTVLEYLLSPVQKVTSEAGRER